MDTAARVLVAVLLLLVVAACGGFGGGGGAGEPPATVRDDAAPPDEEPAPAEGDATTEPEPDQAPPEPPPDPEFVRLPGVTTAQAADLPIGAEELGLWRQAVPRVEDVRIPATGGGPPQPALWLPPEGAGESPLLVVLHSWSSGYLQAASIPFARWADLQRWALVAPHFRGPFDRPVATGSNVAVQDVVDAIDWAVARGGVDADRVYVIGFSGGGMMSLLLAGRAPDRVAAAVSWVPVFDVGDWYVYNRDEQPQAHYAGNILASCGGDPTASEAARASCAHRSPSAHVDAAREAGVPVYIGHGLGDRVVPPSHALRAFNRLAADGDRVGLDAIRAAAGSVLVERLRGRVEAEHFFADGDPPVLFSRQSASATIVLFEGEHDLVYHPGLEWLTRIAAGEGPG